jgi:hypothetical protein
MPLEIKYHAGRFMPVAVCDHCYEEIASAADGNYEWMVEEDGRPWDGHIYFTHKQCCRAFEGERGGGPCWYAIPLECLPVYLGNNLRLRWGAARRLARHLGTL